MISKSRFGAVQKKQNSMKKKIKNEKKLHNMCIKCSLF